MLRATYLLVAVGLGMEAWPAMLDQRPWDPVHGVANSLFSALTLMALVGIRYPLQMLPLLLFDLAWRTLWLVGIALPLWSTQQVDARTLETLEDCVVGLAILPAAIPWRHVLAHYIARRGDRWAERRRFHRVPDPPAHRNH